MILNVKPIVVIVSCMTVAMLLSCANAKKTGNAKPQEKILRQPTPAELWQKFTRAYGDWTVDWNEATGTPHRAWGPSIQIPGFEKITQENVQEAAFQFLSENRQIMGIETGSLKFVRANEANNRWYVSYVQVEKGLEVLKSEVELRISDSGKVMTFGSDFYSNIDVSATPTLSLESAKQQIITGLKLEPQRDSIESQGKLFYLPQKHSKNLEYYLVYKFSVKTSVPKGNLHVYTDAHTGEVRWRHDFVRTNVWR